MKTVTVSILMILGSLPISLARAELINPIAVIATVKVKDQMQDTFKAAASEMVDQTRKEKGSISYKLVQSKTDPTEFATIELWGSQADINLHLASAHVQKFFKIVGGLFAEGYPVIKTYEESIK